MYGENIMKNKAKLYAKVAAMCVICLALTVCGVCPTYAQGRSSTENDIYSKIDDYLRECVKNANIPAMSVSIVNKDSVLFSGNYGQCESSDIPFLLGSVSKSFTAVCIMQLVEQQKISLNAPISDYLSDAADGDKITVSQLLNHTSGLGEHQTLKNYKIVNKQGVHHYANVNYSLLGEIIESVSGRSYSEYISVNLFEQLGLSHTAATLEESIENGLIGGYTNYCGVPIKTTHKYPSSENNWITVPAGYISSSSNDLGKYLQMYLNGGNGVISQESINTMFYGDTVYVEGDIPFWYGYGWAKVKDPLSEPVLRHSGLVETGTSCVFIMPERDIAVAIESNVNDYFVTNEIMDSLGWGVILMILGDQKNEITCSAYILKHLLIDLIMLAVFMSAILPLCFIPRYVHRIQKKKMIFRIVQIIPLHFLLPVLILLFAPIFFSTPLWVVKAFVPDVFATIVVSSSLLFTGGAAKMLLLYISTHKNNGYPDTSIK